MTYDSSLKQNKVSRNENFFVLSTGKMHLWAVPVDGNWSITRIELEVNKLPDRRLLIKDGPKNEEAPADQ